MSQGLRKSWVIGYMQCWFVLPLIPLFPMDSSILLDSLILQVYTDCLDIPLYILRGHMAAFQKNISHPKDCFCHSKHFILVFIVCQSTRLTMSATETCALNRPFKLSVHNRNIIFLFLNQNIHCGHSKEWSQLDCSFDHPNHMLKIMGKKIFTILL